MCDKMSQDRRNSSKYDGLSAPKCPDFGAAPPLDQIVVDLPPIPDKKPGKRHPKISFPLDNEYYWDTDRKTGRINEQNPSFSISINPRSAGERAALRKNLEKQFGKDSVTEFNGVLLVSGVRKSELLELGKRTDVRQINPQAKSEMK